MSSVGTATDWPTTQVTDWGAYLVGRTAESAPRLTRLLLSTEIGASVLALESIFTALAGLSDEQLTTIGEWIRATKKGT